LSPNTQNAVIIYWESWTWSNCH